MSFRNSVVGCWVLFLLGSSCCDAASSSKILLDSGSSGRGPRDLHIQAVPSDAKADNLVAIISSPGTLSSVIDTSATVTSTDDFSLALDDSNACLYAKGPTLNTVPNSPELVSVATCSMVASAIVLDGITEGDVEDGGLPNSRHAVTLTMLFRARLLKQQLENDDAVGDSSDEEEAPISKQGLVLCVPLGADHDDQNLEEDLQSQVQLLYAAVAAENKESASMKFEDLYDLEIQWVSLNESEEVMNKATEKAKSLGNSSSSTLSSALLYAQKNIQESSVASLVVNPPHIATAFITVMNSYTKQSRSVRSKIASWKSRSSRGLLIDNFGSQAEALIERTLDNFDRETLVAVGLGSSSERGNANVASYRKATRAELNDYLETVIPKIFDEQVSNLQTMTMGKFRNQLLRNTVSTSAKYDDQQQMLDSSAAILRAATLLFETGMEQLQIPSLGFTVQKEARKFSNILNNELQVFPDSPRAKLKVAKSVKKVINQQKKPGERAVNFGLDLVAMLRPDGFGSLQGFCGYQLGGNSLTFGVHNDADDPQVIAQFGGVRPPLLRVQPKLKVDVEL